MKTKKKDAFLATVERFAVVEGDLNDAVALLQRVLAMGHFDPSKDITLRSEIEDFVGSIDWR